jgi:Fic-DOC domain mobile mystery protein B
MLQGQFVLTWRQTVTDPLRNNDEATPLAPEERNDLIPTHISSRRELNAAEQTGILSANEWAFERDRDVLDEAFLRELHRRMFGDVWKWAGNLRVARRNLGVEPSRIPSELRLLLDDVRNWIEHHTYPTEEIAVRFHYRLLKIHPFFNGNGRLSRLATDLLARRLGLKRFTWGCGSLISASETRRLYIQALRAADAQDVARLLAFVRS